MDNGQLASCSRFIQQGSRSAYSTDPLELPSPNPSSAMDTLPVGSPLVTSLKVSIFSNSLQMAEKE